MDVTTRRCKECRRDKPVSGVWYLVAKTGVQLFICEACYSGPAGEEISIGARGAA